jgi:hypothetical protein
LGFERQLGKGLRLEGGRCGGSWWRNGYSASQRRCGVR